MEIVQRNEGLANLSQERTVSGAISTPHPGQELSQPTFRAASPPRMGGEKGSLPFRYSTSTSAPGSSRIDRRLGISSRRARIHRPGPGAEVLDDLHNSRGRMGTGHDQATEKVTIKRRERIRELPGPVPHRTFFLPRAAICPFVHENGVLT